MTDLTIDQALENIYASLINDNAGLDNHIIALKKILTAQGTKTAEFDPAKLAQNNRSGRKMMQSYFRQRGIEVTFKAA